MPLRHRGYGAYISCDGAELEVYKTKVENDKVISCYIASEAGKEFKVHWVDSKPPSHLVVEIRMDGRRMGVLSHTKQSSKTSNGGFRIALDAHCPYQFAPLTTTDDDTLPSAYSEELGTIEVRLRRVRDFIAVPFVPKAQSRPGPASIHERNRKGAGPSHYVSLGKTKEVKAKSTILRPVLIDDKPYVTFHFFYRPREYLEDKGIIPSSSTSRTHSVSVPSSSISSADQRRKRPEALEPSHNEPPPAAKRRRTVLEDDVPNDDSFLDVGHAPDDFIMPTEDVGMTDEGDNKENVVEVHLSSKDNYAMPGSSTGCTQQTRAVSVKREPSPDPPIEEVPVRVKREPTPITEIRLSHKNNYAIPTSGSDNVRVKQEPSVKRELSQVIPESSLKREPTPATEVYLSSRNNYSIPRTSCSPARVAVKTQHDRVKEEPSEDMWMQRHHAKDMKLDTEDAEEESIVEIHLSSHEYRNSSVSSRMP
ncbi:hypothetical protein L226DRAFT_530260 [Lentinus tigrinus ALCF2SS1-7]|uniref:DUF7918 domain-containing protein n=1 Tax=Lentinus tigrinus ALCF2SS1-6 TaxID=1328759 RepID=A0A5C2SSM7_9APHY|nr:hypothetical protein L227DRAFT_570055 [Lentinus tigrinus ALCF2SS1-6]RPD80069.1 hypothetical protein L226DRAFT_530260 [Lentinus tigrinus ALCF2SS1-7]